MDRGQPGGGANLSPLSTSFCVYIVVLIIDDY